MSENGQHHRHRHRHHRHHHGRSGAGQRLRDMLTPEEGRMLAIGTVVLLVVLVVGVYCFGSWLETKDRVEPVGTLSEGFGQIPTIEVDGVTYAKRLNQTTILLMGVDHDSSYEADNARSGGQADFQMLLVLDHDRKEIRQLQIDRDTVTPVRVRTILGEDGGVRDLQICLAHGYGTTEEECCANTIEAVETFLSGLTVDLYASIPLDAVGIINGMLGGLTVTVPVDMTAADPQMVEGAVITLRDDQAEIFVRARMTVGDGTNAQRMLRQRAFISAVKERLSELTRESPEFLFSLYDNLGGVMTTDLKKGRLINEANQAYHYEVLPVESLPGEHTYGSTGFQEFHADKNAVQEWILQNCYQVRP